MVKIIYHRDRHRVSITGHAGGEVGNDLVCASVTTLAYTLAAFVKNLESSGQVRYPTVKLDEGDALISCDSARRYKTAITLVYDSICAGFELLSSNHPDKILYEIRCGESRK